MQSSLILKDAQAAPASKRQDRGKQDASKAASSQAKAKQEAGKRLYSVCIKA
jgi:hypothetical protein